MKNKGLALIEVVALLFVAGVVAAVAIPETRTATPEHQTRALIDALEDVRTAVEQYRRDHGADFPTLQMLDELTESARTLRSRQGFAAYLDRLPVNPFTNGKQIAPTNAPIGTADWVYDPESGIFKANDTAQHRDL